MNTIPKLRLGNTSKPKKPTFSTTLTPKPSYKGFSKPSASLEPIICTGELAGSKSWEPVPYEKKLHVVSDLDLKRAEEFALYGVEVFKEDDVYTVTIGGPDNLFIQTEGGDAAVALASGLVAIIRAERALALAHGMKLGASVTVTVAKKGKSLP